ncbi:MAG: MarR family transcriptional regulator [Gammaproteobacteria bacterium]|nr:MarR family transcriptional regulator [Gammaproteobacteria bacterium]
MARSKSNIATDRADDTSEEDWGIRLGFSIHDTSRLRRIIYNQALKPAGVTRSQAWVLAYLSRQDGMAQSELAAELDLGKVALGGLVDRLEAAGMVERRGDARDRRMKRIFLTAVGRKVINKMREISAVTNTRILEGVDPAEVRATVRTLQRIKANLLRMAAAARNGEA